MIAEGTTISHEAPSSLARTLVLGLGNPLLSDDGAGLQAVRQLRPRLAGRLGIAVAENYAGGLRLMEQMIGFDRVILVDAICSGAIAGAVHLLSGNEISTQHSASAHDVNLPTALALGREAGARLPADENIRLVAIEAADVLSFNEECTPPVRAGIERAVQAVLTILAAWR